MKKRILAAIAAIAAITVVFTGCGDVANTVSDAVAQVITGNVKGEVGKTYATKWFEFSVDSIEFVDSYAGYTPAEGNTLIDVALTETGTFSEPSPMGIYDFYVDQSSFIEYVYPLEALDDTMMPTQFPLADGETVTYHMVYEVPADITGMTLHYTEMDEEDNIGNTFTVNIN